MKQRKNMAAKIVATLALLSIIIWVIGTGMLFLFWWNTSRNQNQYTQEEIEELIQSFSWSTSITASWSQDTDSIIE